MCCHKSVSEFLGELAFDIIMIYIDKIRLYERQYSSLLW